MPPMSTPLPLYGALPQEYERSLGIGAAVYAY